MRRFLAALGGLVLGVALSQFPEYAQQYTQRLGGAVDELRILTEEFDGAATDAGLSRQQALARYQEAGDEFVAGRGVAMDRTFLRYDQLSTLLVEIRGLDGWQRLERLPGYFDSEIGRRTMADFRPAVPVTIEGLAYAGVGFGLGYLVVSALVRLVLLPFKLWWRRRRNRRNAADPAAAA